MPKQQYEAHAGRFQLSTDVWAVITAIALAVLVKFGVLPRVPW
jgi:hypothetical protein